MSLRNYIDNAPTSQLTANATTADGLLTVNSTTGVPASPYTATLDLNTPSAEVVLVTAVAGLQLTVTRNYDGHGAYAHPTGATVDHTAVAKDFSEANSHVNSNTGVHGVTGAVVGTTDAQTLSNKTLNQPVLNNPTYTNTAQAGFLHYSGGSNLLSASSPLTASTLAQGTIVRVELTASISTTGSGLATPSVAVSGAATGTVTFNSGSAQLATSTVGNTLTTYALYTVPTTGSYVFTLSWAGGTGGAAAFLFLTSTLPQL